MINPMARIPGENAERYLQRRAKFFRDWIRPGIIGLIAAITLKIFGFY